MAHPHIIVFLRSYTQQDLMRIEILNGDVLSSLGFYFHGTVLPELHA
jgi:hypothetical protein